MQIISSKYGNLYLQKEKGNLYRKGKDGKSRPIMYQIYLNNMEPLGLWDYKSIRNIDLMDAVNELINSDVVFLNNTFNIAFYEKKDALKIIDLLEDY